MSTAVRHEYYQTDEKVVVTIFLKKVDELNCKVTIESDRLLIEADGDIRLDFHLCESINTEKSSYNIGSVKVEVTLMKLFVGNWADLTKEKAEMNPDKMQIYRKNWDALQKSIDQEKAEGDGTPIYQNLPLKTPIYENIPPQTPVYENVSLEPAMYENVFLEAHQFRPLE